MTAREASRRGLLSLLLTRSVAPLEVVICKVCRLGGWKSWRDEKDGRTKKLKGRNWMDEKIGWIKKRCSVACSTFFSVSVSFTNAVICKAFGFITV